MLRDTTTHLTAIHYIPNHDYMAMTTAQVLKRSLFAQQQKQLKRRSSSQSHQSSRIPLPPLLCHLKPQLSLAVADLQGLQNQLVHKTMLHLAVGKVRMGVWDRSREGGQLGKVHLVKVMMMIISV